MLDRIFQYMCHFDELYHELVLVQDHVLILQLYLIEDLEKKLNA